MTAKPGNKPASCTTQEVEAFRTFMRAHALLVGAIEQDLAAAELPPLAWHDVLATLDAAPEGRMRIHELADAIVFSRSGLSRLLDRLEREELLRRERSPNDRRGAYAVLTDSGRATLDQMSAVYRRTVDEHFLPHLGDEVEALKTSLERVSDSAREACPIDAASLAPAGPSSAPRR
ncbi:MAG TPA: MarR family transcriptional regulator [Solirubrobacterales bacterium]|nr:MarR family transcriptional regulator [Solirubrobacterales bacterium]